MVVGSTSSTRLVGKTCFIDGQITRLYSSVANENGLEKIDLNLHRYN